MIYPTAKAALLVGAGAVAALILAALAPGLWAAGLALIALAVGLLAADAWLSPWPSAVTARLDAPGALQVGRKETAVADISVNGRRFASVKSSGDERLYRRRARRRRAQFPPDAGAAGRRAKSGNCGFAGAAPSALSTSRMYARSARNP